MSILIAVHALKDIEARVGKQRKYLGEELEERGPGKEDEEDGNKEEDEKDEEMAEGDEITTLPAYRTYEYEVDIPFAAKDREHRWLWSQRLRTSGKIQRQNAWDHANGEENYEHAPADPNGGIQGFGRDESHGAVP
jgi:molybdopterin converting factor small subunit